MASKDLERFRSLATSMFTNGLRFVSGKYFLNDKEVKNIKGLVCHSAHKILTDKEMEQILELVRTACECEDLEKVTGFWPEIVWPEVHGDLPFPLDEKQLVIINRLLYHRLDNKDRNLFITTGIGGSGKSTFLNIIRQLHYDDCSNSSISDLKNEFIIAEAASKRLICADEIGSKDLDCEKLKQLASHNIMTINPKFVRPYQVHTQSNFFWCCNNIPHIDIGDSGMLRRIVFYERNTKIDNPNPDLAQKRFSPEELAIIATEAKKYDCDDWFERYFEEETHKWLMLSNSVWRYWTNDYHTYDMQCTYGRKRPFSEDKWREIHEIFERWYEQCSNKDELNTSIVLR